ncbi:MAG: hypothetical protein ACK56I_31120, partial [bacterium]
AALKKASTMWTPAKELNKALDSLESRFSLKPVPRFAEKGFWDPQQKLWNESKGGQAAYIAQREHRREVRNARKRRVPASLTYFSAISQDIQSNPHIRGNRLVSYSDTESAVPNQITDYGLLH